MALPRLDPLFFFNDTATTEIYTLSLHDALPIWRRVRGRRRSGGLGPQGREAQRGDGRHPRRDRLRPGGERRGVRQVVRPEGRGMTEGPPFPPDVPGGPIGANPSFFDLVRTRRPETLPAPTAAVEVSVPHGTTVVALKFGSGVVFGGDPPATEGV